MMGRITRQFARSLAAVLALAVVVAAGAQGRQVYDLKRVVETALANYPGLAAAAEDTAAARAQVGQAVAAARPKLDAKFGYTRLQDDPSFTVPGFGTLVFGERNNYQAEVDLQVPVYTGGLLEGMKDRAKAGEDAALKTEERRRQEVAANAAKAYFQALSAQRMIGVMEGQVKALQESHRAAKAMFEAGTVAKLDVLRPEVALAAGEDGLRQAQSGYDVALASLANAIGLAPGAPLELAADAVTLPIPEDVGAARKTALDQRPELAQLAANRRAALASETMARSGKKPQVGVFARNEFKRPTTYPDTGDWSVGVQLTQNLFDGGAVDAQSAEAAARIRQLDDRQRELRNGIALEVTAALLNAYSARDRIATTSKAVAAAEEALKLAQVGYANAVTPMLDVLQAQAALTRARADAENAAYDYNVAAIGVASAMGEIGMMAAQPAK